MSLDKTWDKEVFEGLVVGSCWTAQSGNSFFIFRVLEVRHDLPGLCKLVIDYVGFRSPQVFDFAAVLDLKKRCNAQQITYSQYLCLKTVEEGFFR